MRCASKHTEISARSGTFFMERWAVQVGDYCRKQDVTEIHPPMPIIHVVSPFQAHRIYQWTWLQYSPTRWVYPICSGIVCGWLTGFGDEYAARFPRQPRQALTNIAGSGTPQKSILQHHI